MKQYHMEGKLFLTVCFELVLFAKRIGQKLLLLLLSLFCIYIALNLP